MNKDCANKVNECLPCNDFPIENLSAEGLDDPTYLGSYIVLEDPGIGDVWSAEGCNGFEFSTISIEDATMQAALQDCGTNFFPPPPPDPDPDPPPPPDPPLPPECLFPRCDHPTDVLCDERPRLESLAAGWVVFCEVVDNIGGAYCAWRHYADLGSFPAVGGALYAYSNTDPVNYDSWIASICVFTGPLGPIECYCARHVWDASDRPPEAVYTLNDAGGQCVFTEIGWTSINSPIQVTLEVPPP